MAEITTQYSSSNIFLQLGTKTRRWKIFFNNYEIVSASMKLENFYPVKVNFSSRQKLFDTYTTPTSQKLVFSARKLEHLPGRHLKIFWIIVDKIWGKEKRKIFYKAVVLLFGDKLMLFTFPLKARRKKKLCNFFILFARVALN